MAQNNLDTKVRLSAEGVDEVVRALQRVQKQAQETGKSGGKGVGLLNQALGDLQGILPQLGIAGAVTGLGYMVKKALDSADAIGKLSQKTGVSSETLSVLNVAAETADVNFEQLGKGLEKFNKVMGELDNGSSQAAAAVRRLFGSSQALNGLDTEQRLLKVFKALGKMQDGFQKTKAAMDFFGKSGAELIPFLNDLSGDGFEKFKEKTQQLGLVIDKDLAEAAQRANDSFKTLQQAAQGAATQFAAGFAPGLADSVETITKAVTGEGVNGFRMLGDIGGTAIKYITSNLLTLGKVVGGILAQLDNLADLMMKTARNSAGFVLLQKNPAQWLRDQVASLKEFGSQAKLRAQFTVSDIGATVNGLFSAHGAIAASTPAKPQPGGKAPMPDSDKARLELLKQRLQNELALFEKYQALEEANAKEAFDRGAFALSEYFNHRKDIIETGADEEIATLKKQRDLLAKASLGITPEDSDDTAGAKRLKRKQELEALDAQIAQKGVERETKLRALADERFKAEEAIAQKRLDIEQQILEAQGKTYEAALLAIQRQIKELEKAHVPVEDLQALQDTLQRQAKAKELDRQSGLAFGEVDLVQQRIQNQVDAGELFPTEAAQKYASAIQDLIVQLETYAQEKLATAVTPEEVQAADQMVAKINDLKVSVNQGAKEMAQFKAATEQALTSDLTNFFTKGIDEAHNFGDAMRGLALSVIDSLRQIAAQMLATLAVQQLLKAVSAIGSGFSGGGQVHAAEGGYISGPGTGTSDSIPARLSDGEFVVRSAVVQQPGVLEHLAALNRGMGTPFLRGSGGTPRFATGGLVTAGEVGMGGGGFDATLRLDKGLILDTMKSKEGSRVTVQHLGNNQKAARRALGG